MADEDWPRYNRTNTLNLLSERESSPDQQTTGSNVGGDGFARLHEWGYTSDGEGIVNLIKMIEIITEKNLESGASSLFSRSYIPF